MTWFADLAPCTYLPVAAPTLLAVGWLEHGHDYAKGEVPPAFFERLEQLAYRPWQPMIAAGHHVCDLCQFDGARSGEIVFVPGGGVTYAAPVGIVHYVAAHRYRPPQAFVDAVLACPPTGTAAYLKALLDNGGRVLVEAASG